MEVGKRIRQERTAAKLKQSELSEEMCITVAMLSKIERGVCMCTPDNMLYLCKKFHKPADYFYFGRNIHANTSDVKSMEQMVEEIETMLHRLNPCEVEKTYQIMKIVM